MITATFLFLVEYASLYTTFVEEKVYSFDIDESIYNDKEAMDKFLYKKAEEMLGLRTILNIYEITRIF